MPGGGDDDKSWRRGTKPAGLMRPVGTPRPEESADDKALRRG